MVMLGVKAENLEKLVTQKECGRKVKTRTLQKPKHAAPPLCLSAERLPPAAHKLDFTVTN